MNFLAHLYLSHNNYDWMVGNFIADAVKGSAFNDYSEGIKEGILLHRSIDSFTDQHPIVKESVALIRFQQGKYAPVVLDILFDYYLAKDWSNYHNQSLADFSTHAYEVLGTFEAVFPEPMPFVFHMMKNNNWLYNYQFISGIEKSLNGMQNRVNYPNNMANGAALLTIKGEELQENFNQFFEALRNEFSLKV